MKPYYDEDGVTIYHGDARDFGGLSCDSLITDPVWPNSVFPGVDPYGLLGTVLSLELAATVRVAVHLGCDSDPRILGCVPRRWAFFRVCWLDYALPSYKGRLLYGSDVAYLFGEPPPPRPGAFLVPGKCVAQRTGYKVQYKAGSSERDRPDAHPCPRRIQHVDFLVRVWGGSHVLDPFMGTGTTALACKKQGVRFTGIEIEERYCEIAAKRLAQRQIEWPEEVAAVEAHL